jgi:hypothetical protein
VKRVAIYLAELEYLESSIKSVVVNMYLRLIDEERCETLAAIRRLHTSSLSRIEGNLSSMKTAMWERKHER